MEKKLEEVYTLSGYDEKELLSIEGKKIKVLRLILNEKPCFIFNLEKKIGDIGIVEDDLDYIRLYFQDSSKLEEPVDAIKDIDLGYLSLDFKESEKKVDMILRVKTGEPFLQLPVYSGIELPDFPSYTFNPEYL